VGVLQPTLSAIRGGPDGLLLRDCNGTVLLTIFPIPLGLLERLSFRMGKPIGLGEQLSFQLLKQILDVADDALRIVRKRAVG